MEYSEPCDETRRDHTEITPRSQSDATRALSGGGHAPARHRRSRRQTCGGTCHCTAADPTAAPAAMVATAAAAGARAARTALVAADVRAMMIRLVSGVDLVRRRAVCPHCVLGTFGAVNAGNCRGARAVGERRAHGVLVIGKEMADVPVGCGRGRRRHPGACRARRDARCRAPFYRHVCHRRDRLRGPCFSNETLWRVVADERR